MPVWRGSQPLRVLASLVKLHNDGRMDDLDFLDLADAPQPDADVAAEMERERAALLDWAAGALTARHPELRKERGTQCVAHGRRDMDAHLRRLHEAVKAADPAAWQTYAAWSQTHERGAHFDWDLEMLTEAVQRFFTPATADVCLRFLRG